MLRRYLNDRRHSTTCLSRDLLVRLGQHHSGAPKGCVIAANTKEPSVPTRPSFSRPSRDNVVPFPTATPPRRSRDAARDEVAGTAAEIVRLPGKVTVLPPARPAPLPPASKAPAEPVAYCSAGEACVAHPTLDSPARLSRHNRQRIDGERYCYGCLARIADERTRTLDSRRRPEASAASRHKRRGSRGDGSSEPRRQIASRSGAAGRIPSVGGVQAGGVP